MKRADIEALAFRLARHPPSDLDCLQAACILRGLAGEPDGEALAHRWLHGLAPAAPKEPAAMAEAGTAA